ncbi:MAG: (Fe-S)-binding protein [Desulfobacterales bacterium]|nr:(Fe-S)-binding protein [Desulfobacterales bacterium]
MSSSVFDIIDHVAILAATSQCLDCRACAEVCCTADTRPLLTPYKRLEICDRVARDLPPLPEEIRTLYLCTECGRCDTVCPQEISISGAIADTKVLMVQKGMGPLEKHDTMTQAIFKNRNAVGKPADQRLDWIPESLKEKVTFEDAPGDTLLYVGCLSSYMDKASAAASLEILLTAGVDVKLLKDEYCCGIYPYNAGKWEEAKAIFTEMAETFEKSGIKRIIVPCAGCHRAFSHYYPRLLSDFHIEVLHIAQVIENLIHQGRLELKTDQETSVTIHDACKTGRKFGIYSQPRDIVKACGLDIAELPEKEESAPCCGSGAGVRSIDPQLSMAIATKLLDVAPSKTIVSTCPFCIFNMNYTARKTKSPQKAIHIASLVKEHL